MSRLPVYYTSSPSSRLPDTSTRYGNVLGSSSFSVVPNPNDEHTYGRSSTSSVSSYGSRHSTSSRPTASSSVSTVRRSSDMHGVSSQLSSLSMGKSPSGTSYRSPVSSSLDARDTSSTRRSTDASPSTSPSRYANLRRSLPSTSRSSLDGASVSNDSRLSSSPRRSVDPTDNSPTASLNSKTVYPTQSTGVDSDSARKKRLLSELQLGLVGLDNLGNTCFMNSTLQCLLKAEPVFMELLLNVHNLKARVKPGGLTDTFLDLLRKTWSAPDYSSVPPAAFKSALGKWQTRFRGYSQEDAQELLRYVLDGLHEELNRVKKKEYRELKDIDGESVVQQSQRWWNYFLERNDSPIVDIFAGQLMSSVICSKCKHESRAFDPFMDLSLSIPKRFQSKSFFSRFTTSSSRDGKECTIHDCLEDFTSEEQLTGNDTVYCSACKKHRSASKRMQLFRFPRVLVLQLKRFESSSWGLRKKLNTFVDFPAKGLDLSEYMGPDADSVNQGRKPLYDLFGTVLHSGNLGFGHYYAHCMNFRNEKWYDFNDSHVSGIHDSDLHSSSVYLLFYKLRES